MISIKDLTKKYTGSGVVVDHLSFEVSGGECLVLVGKSGCGKSTLLRMINGLIRSDEGEVWIEGTRLVSEGIPIRRRKIGFVVQQGGLFPHLNVFENISLIAKLTGSSKKEREDRVEELLTLVNLDPIRYASKYPRELSGGEQQRVGVARALMLDPPILLMDEPFGALDPITRRQIQKDFLDLQRKIARKTILFVTHDMQEAFLMANRIAIMDAGKILQIGTPEEIRQNPASSFVADFFRGVA
ncbi:MAG: ATP-binding cassette domain-containing protein [Deltaproteobacteria bacterium]|nr:ATP-binding cassette domain-containing protein [Deltaproteobacteria bacterium]MBI4374034.1 ATP-binding cassette domain-containing protein [Deltaproteobacteria bacterium]